MVVRPGVTVGGPDHDRPPYAVGTAAHLTKEQSPMNDMERLDLRVEPPRLEPDEAILHRLTQLAAASAASAVIRPRTARNGVIVGLAAASVAALVGGVAWASGAGSEHPDPPTNPAPAHTSTPSDPAVGGTTRSDDDRGEDADDQGVEPEDRAGDEPASSPRDPADDQGDDQGDEPAQPQQSDDDQGNDEGNGPDEHAGTHPDTHAAPSGTEHGRDGEPHGDQGRPVDNGGQGDKGDQGDNGDRDGDS